MDGNQKRHVKHQYHSQKTWLSGTYTKGQTDNSEDDTSQHGNKYHRVDGKFQPQTP